MNTAQAVVVLLLDQIQILAWYIWPINSAATNDTGWHNSPYIAPWYKNKIHMYSINPLPYMRYSDTFLMKASDEQNEYIMKKENANLGWFRKFVWRMKNLLMMRNSFISYNVFNASCTTAASNVVSMW